MSRNAIAAFVGLIFLVLYLLAALAIADFLVTAHWLLQVLFYVPVGLLWVLPIYRLMVWAAHSRK